MKKNLKLLLFSSLVTLTFTIPSQTHGMEQINYRMMNDSDISTTIKKLDNIAQLSCDELGKVMEDLNTHFICMPKESHLKKKEAEFLLLDEGSSFIKVFADIGAVKMELESLPKKYPLNILNNASLINIDAKAREGIKDLLNVMLNLYS